MIDSTLVMYEAFQSCRHLRRDAPSSLRLLATALDAVHRQNSLRVDLPLEIPRSWTGFGQSRLPGPEAEAPHTEFLTPAHTKILAAIDAGAAELELLTASGESEAVRGLGYALHVLPAHLWAPGDFNPRLYAFNLGIAARKWDVLSDNMRNALFALVGQDVARAVLRKVRSEPHGA